jgi:hypothetical protein
MWLTGTDSMSCKRIDRPDGVSFAEAMALLANNRMPAGCFTTESPGTDMTTPRHPSFFFSPPIAEFQPGTVPRRCCPASTTPPEHDHSDPSFSPPSRRATPSKSRSQAAPTNTARRSKDSMFTCKVCIRSLSGDHFYERHLQCITCQMAINSVARTVKVPHSDAKRAYIEAINKLTMEEHTQLDSHRNGIHVDAERLLRTCPEVVLERAPPLPKRRPAAQSRSAVKRASPNLDSQPEPSKRACGPERNLGNVSQQITCGGIWGPHHGLLLLIKACESDLAELN